MKERERFKIFKEVFSESTVKAIYKLFKDGYIDYIIGPISTGKEANVFLGKNIEGESIAIKIYRIETSDFKNMWKYICGDPRFENVKRRRRDIIYAWAKKEFKNLEIALNAKVKVPEPITFRKNILIMSFIGEDGVPAPVAKDVPPKNPEKWLKIIINYIKKLFNSNLIHGDLSEYNILNFKEIPYLIDFGQGVLKDYPFAEDLLKKDIRNIINWIKKLKIKTPSPEKVYKEVTGKSSRNGI